MTRGRTSVTWPILAFSACAALSVACMVRLSDPYKDYSKDGNVSPGQDCNIEQGHAAQTGPAAVRIVGRSAPDATTGATRIFYSGTRITARFVGASSVYMKLGVDPEHQNNHDIDKAAAATNNLAFDETQYALSHPAQTFYQVLVDGTAVPGSPLPRDGISNPDGMTLKAGDVMQLASGLDANATHEIVIVRESEAQAGAHLFYGLFSDANATAALKYQPSTVKPRRIQVIGDSISCGFGVLGTNAGCTFDYTTERASLAYWALAADALDAEVTPVMQSGIGVFKNSDSTCARVATNGDPMSADTPCSLKPPPPLVVASSAEGGTEGGVVSTGNGPADTSTGRPMFYVYQCIDPTADPCDCTPYSLKDGVVSNNNACDEALASTQAVDPTADPNPPQVVVVNLGTNDVLLGLASQSDFETAYEAFINQLRGYYPNAQIFCALSPMLSDLSTGGLRTLAKNAISTAVNNIRNTDPKVYYLEFPDQGTENGLGCQFHPNATTHKIMAGILETAIREKTCWQ
jgi:hypothetical protein